MKRASSIRVQLSIALAGIVLVIVAAAGLAIAIRIDQRDRAQVDSAMVARSAHIEGDLDTILRDARPGAVQSSPDTFGGLLGASQSLVRVIVGGELAVERGQLSVAPIPLPDHDGFSSLVVDGDSWRSYVRTTQTRNGVQLQVLQSLQPLDERKTRNALLVLAVTAAATVLGAGVGWLVAGVLLRPLQRVRAAAVAIRDDHDTEHRLPAVRSPREVADLADTLNDMLDRLQKSAATARRFTADAGHELRTPLTSLGAYIETLNGPSEPNVELRRQITTEMAVEYRRLVDLLTGLQSLARGDSGALPAFVEVDVLEVVQDAVAAARRRHQGVVVNGPKFEEYARVLGWPDGIRLAVDNLLDNAALHGKSDGVITVRLTADHDVVSVSVDDDGPGIAAAQRPSMLKRFTRGASATASGSGLGLALVAQQAEIHRGRIDLTESAAGGLSATLTLPAERRPGR